MSGRSVIAYLRELCDQLDTTGLDTVRLRKIAVILSLPAAALAQGCRVDDPSPSVLLYGVPEYGASFEEICGDDIDNDYDALIDCDDDACATLEVCLSCNDGQDNDGNDMADCDDPSCRYGELCQGACDDDVDNDSDGLVDCDDPHCAGTPECP